MQKPLLHLPVKHEYLHLDRSHWSSQGLLVSIESVLNRSLRASHQKPSVSKKDFSKTKSP